MSSQGKVRTHQRRTPSGETTTVHQHTRRSGGRRRGLLSPGHSWKLARSAFRAARRNKRATAALLGGLAVTELGAWLTLRGAVLVLATAGVLVLGFAALAAAATGGEI